jgi:hypothetical protein
VASQVVAAHATALLGQEAAQQRPRQTFDEQASSAVLVDVGSQGIPFCSFGMQIFCAQ